MKRIKCNKNWIKKDSNINEEVIEEKEIKEEGKMGLFKKHMDKFIIGGLTGVAALLLGCLIASKINPSDEGESCDSDDEISETDVASEFESGNVVRF